MKSYIEKVKEIQDELKWDPELFDSEISVEIKDNIVTLSGKVLNEKKKKAAERVVKNFDGIKSVVNNLLVSKADHHDEAPVQVPTPNSGDPDKSLKVSGA